MTAPQHSLTLAGARASVLAGADVCAAAGFRLRPGGHAVMFDDDVWPFGDIDGRVAELADRRAGPLARRGDPGPLRPLPR